MHRTLHDHWTLRPVAGPVPPEVAATGAIAATVPGTVHTDLLAAGLIADPYLDDNERLLAWIGRADWCYQTTFTWSPDGDEHVELVFEGLDTVARLELNGHPLGETRNMHRTYRFGVRELLRDGDNVLSVTFSSAIGYADRASLELGARPHVNHHPYNAIRKMAANFGWDWGPDLVTAGIWRPVTLRSWSRARLDAVRPVVDVVDSRGTVEVHLDLVRTDTTDQFAVTASVAGVTVTRPLLGEETNVVVVLTVEEVQRWWPRGHGAQPLYDLEVRLHPADGDTTVDTWRGRVGFRTLRLVTRADEHGTAVGFVVNDRPVFAKGANWIPDDVFPHRVDRPRYADRLAQAEEAGLNLLRVWGGGIYEADDFYQECDERGLLVWQDFLFTCAAYSEEEPLRAEVIAEARDNVTRLMPHPSLAHWNGGNENIWGYADWDWPTRLDGRSWGIGYYTEVLPAVVSELDPARSYSAGSPWSFSADRHPNDAAHGLMHIWDVWNDLDYPAYRGHRPRFVAEFGWQGPPTWSTLRRALRDDPLTPESPGMIGHQKAANGNNKLIDGLVAHLPVPDDMDDWHWAMSLNQARAVRTGIEYFRSLSPWCAGSVMWQLNDCWPVVSWSAVDGDGRRKPLFYALRHAHTDRLVTVQPDGDGLRAVLVNDTADEWAAEVEVTRCGFDGKTMVAGEFAVTVAPWSTDGIDLPSMLSTTDCPGAEVLVVAEGGRRVFWSYAEDRDSALPEPNLDAVARAVDGGYQVTVTANVYLRDLALLVDKVDPAAVVDDMLVTLLPGDQVTWRVTSERTFEPDELLAPNVLRCANQVARPKRIGG